MAKIADVLQTERSRQESTEWNKIHLFQMGDFYRAYEWSAWLIVAITYNDEVRKQSRDSTMVDPDRDWLIAQVPKIREFLADELDLQLHMGKLHVREVSQGIEFLGAFLKPYRDYVSRRTLERVERKIQDMDLMDAEKVSRTVNSYLGIMSHSASYRVRRQLFDTDNFARIVEIDCDMLKCRAA